MKLGKVVHVCNFMIDIFEVHQHKPISNTETGCVLFNETHCLTTISGRVNPGLRFQIFYSDF